MALTRKTSRAFRRIVAVGATALAIVAATSGCEVTQINSINDFDLQTYH